MSCERLNLWFESKVEKCIVEASPSGEITCYSIDVRWNGMYTIQVDSVICIMGFTHCIRVQVDSVTCVMPGSPRTHICF